MGSILSWNLFLCLLQFSIFFISTKCLSYHDIVRGKFTPGNNLRNHVCAAFNNAFHYLHNPDFTFNSETLNLAQILYWITSLFYFYNWSSLFHLVRMHPRLCIFHQHSRYFTSIVSLSTYKIILQFPLTFFCNLMCVCRCIAAYS